MATTRSIVQRALGLVVALAVLGGAIYIYVESRGYYYTSPGDAPVVASSTECHPNGSGFRLPDGRLCVSLTLPPGKAQPVAGSVMMVDVLFGQASFLQYLEYRLGILGTGTSLIPANAYPPASQLGCESDQDMSDSTAYATALALQHVGYTVTADHLGAQVYEVLPGSAASAAGVRCGDVLTAVDGHSVATTDQLHTVLVADKPGQEVMLTLSRPGTGTVHLTARLNAAPGKPAQAFLGVQISDKLRYHYPFPVQISVGDIGGPSAGLALTLGLIDTLGGGHLTGGLHVAATGEVDPAGDVLDVGGVTQKAVAVRRAGATVFLVPTDEVAQARKTAGSMKVYGVSSVDQALSILQSLGGSPPARS